MAPTLLPVLRSLELSSAYISILDCTPSPTLIALASHHRLQCSSRLEHLTVYDVAHSSLQRRGVRRATINEEVGGVYDVKVLYSSDLISQSEHTTKYVL